MLLSSSYTRRWGRGRLILSSLRGFSSFQTLNLPGHLRWPSQPFLTSTALKSHQLPCARLIPHSLCTTRSYSAPTLSEHNLPNFAFAFDIDGVLLRSSELLPGATKALKYLNYHSIPFILLTNGGGKLESTRVAELSKKLRVPLTEQNFVQSHTPFKDMVNGSNSAESLENKTILVTGSDQDKAREIAKAYGFKNVITPADILQAYPKIWPFNQVFTDYYAKIAQPLPLPINLEDLSSSLKIDAIFIFNDPRDWGLDSQIILDLLMSQSGYLGTYSSKNGDQALPNNGWQQDNQPPITFSNPDLFWAAGYHLPRLGQGGFRSALDGIWNEVTDGVQLHKTVIGKPYALTYQYAERMLQRHRAELLGPNFSRDTMPKLHRVFMVGDNPESDIRGANEFASPEGTEWISILVKSGVYREGTRPKYEPEIVVDGVLAAVRWALKKEGYTGKVDPALNGDEN